MRRAALHRRGEAANASQALVCLATHECDLLLSTCRCRPDGTHRRRAGHEDAGAGDRLRPGACPARAPAFDLEAIDYLTSRSSANGCRWRCAASPTAPAASGRRAAVPANDEGPVIVVSDRGRIIRVPVADVLYLKAELKYVTLRTAEHTHVLDDSLAELEERLGDHFLRVHRNALVARRAVRALERRTLAGEEDEGAEGWAVCMAPVDEWLAVSRRQVAAVREALVAAGR